MNTITKSSLTYKKTIAYVDGYNLYHGMMDRKNNVPNDSSQTPLRKYLWLNLFTFISSFLPLECKLARINYFTAPIRDNPASLERQHTYWKALESFSTLRIQTGKHIKKGESYAEKQTDIKMALQMYDDAFHEIDLEVMVLVSADSDQVPTIERIHSLNKNIEFYAIFPPCRRSDDLIKLIGQHRCFKTKYKRLKEHQFPDTIESQNYSVSKPIEWD